METIQFLKEKETLIGIKYKFSNYIFVSNGIKTNEDVIVKEIIKENFPALKLCSDERSLLVPKKD